MVTAVMEERAALLDPLKEPLLLLMEGLVAGVFGILALVVLIEH
jgi:hypothetical protein